MIRFKKKYILYLLVFCGYFNAAAQQIEIPSKTLTDADWQKLPEHPRLFANNARIASLKLQKDEVSKHLLALLKADATQKLLWDKMVYPTQKKFKFEAVRNVQGRILSCALSYRLFGDRRYLERAKSELLQLAELPDWCPTHFLDVGEAAMAAGVGFDWLYGELTAEERLKVVDAIVKKALLPSLESKEAPHNQSWVNGNFNWNPVCHAGLTIAALAIAEEMPSLARQIVERGIQNIPYAGAEYAPDGSYPEGPSYWSYGTSFYVLEIEALRTVLGNTCGLEKMEGFLKTADFKNQMIAPTGEDFNYSDYHKESSNEPILLWFGKETSRLDLVENELKYIKKIYNSNNRPSDNSKIELHRHFALEVLWWQPSLLGQHRVFPKRHWTAKGGLPLSVIRSDFGDAHASFMAMKGGTPHYSHGQMDVGSFILEADSVRWAVDLGSESYDKMRAARLDLWNYAQNSSRWTTFRVGAEGHNILRFNNALQAVTGFGTIEPCPDSTGIVGGDKMDLSTLYKSQVDKVTRTIQLFENRSMVIEDEWVTDSNSVEVTFQWLTFARATLKPYGILLEQNGKSMQLKVDTGPINKFPEIVIEAASQAKNLQDSDNPGLSRIVIRLKTPAKSTSRMKVTAIPNRSTH